MKDDRFEGKIYCLYCKNEIIGDYVVRGDNLYHPDCYELIKSDSYGIDPDEYDETNTDME
jgi:hypothetical protein